MDDLTIFPSYYRPLSLRLCRILEDTGASLEVREIHEESAKCGELLSTVANERKSYIFGSLYEGTRTSGLNSDIDIVQVDDMFRVVNKQQDTPEKNYLLMVQDPDTPAGYAKLQIVENNIPLTWFNSANLHEYCFTATFDRRGRLMYASDLDRVEGIIFDEKHGPALTRNIRAIKQSFDIVPALQNDSIPDCALEWFTRQRHYGVPKPSVIEACKSLGCLFVTVGHPFSEEKHLEWRISLSRQERVLVSDFSDVQFKCYILLKMIKKDFIHPHINKTAFTSYNCKTCMFYMVENTDPRFWRPENLLACLLGCLQLFIVWTELGTCPNYFIPDENMFEKPFGHVVLSQLSYKLQKLVSEDLKWLVQIKCDRIGERLEQSLNFPLSSNTVKEGINFQHQIMIHRHATNAMLTNFRNGLLHVRYTGNDHRYVTSIVNELSTLRAIRLISGYSEYVTQCAISMFFPHIELALMSSLTAMAVKQCRSTEEIWRYVTSNKWYDLSIIMDPYSSKLKQATFMTVLGHNEAALDILNSLDTEKGVSCCSCDPRNLIFRFINNVTETIDLFEGEIVLPPCILFMPTEREATPIALRYEMNRLDGRTPDRWAQLNCYWYNWAIIDGIFLMHFLLFLNHKELDEIVNAEADVANMEWIINIFELGHKETALNILGWVYKSQNNMDQARRCFAMSLAIKGEYNAAHLHLRDMYG